MSLLAKIRKDKVVKDLVYSGDIDQEFINTGTLALNVLYSGKLDGGIPKNKISMIAGFSASSKSYQALKVIKGAQKMGMEVILIDSEYAYSPGFAESVGCVTSDDKLLVIQENEIEKVQQIVLSSLKDLSKAEKENVLIVIDSWGGLTTSKTRGDAEIGKDTVDMTIAKKKNALSRLLTGLFPTTIFIVNQTYDCGTENMLVTIPDGTKSLKDLKVGDSVLTANGFEDVLNKFEYDDAPVYEVVMENGDVLEFTENHKVLVKCGDGLVERKYKAVGELTSDDEIAEYY